MHHHNAVMHQTDADVHHHDAELQKWRAMNQKILS